MLSRTAENLYWSARYIERADSIARILEVGYRISLIPNTQKGYSNEWEAILQSSGIKEEYLSKYKEIKKDKIEYFLLLDENNTSSIINCFSKARENIKSVRTAVTLEVWNTINSCFHEIEVIKKQKYLSKRLPEHIDWVKKQVNLIKGTIFNTQLVNDGYDFIILGIFFERADFTARLINVKYFILLPSTNYIGKEIDNFQWSLMLRSISSFRAFKWAYGNNNITYLTIIDFLILNIISPRSLIYSVKKINEHLKNLKKYYKQKSIVESRSNELYLKLKKLKADEISEYGLHEFVKIFIKDLSNINNNLEKKYFLGLSK